MTPAGNASGRTCRILLMVLATAAAPCGGAIACNVDMAPLAFGTINPLDRTDTDSVAVLTVTCPAETAYSAAASAGNGGFTDRTMASGGSLLRYQLYMEASRSIVWGDGTTGTSAIQGTAGPAGTPSQVYGRVPAQPLAVPGAYVDTLVVTITY